MDAWQDLALAVIEAQARRRERRQSASTALL
jgi:hypothetical protein